MGFIKKFIIFLFSLGLFGSGSLFLWAATLQIPDLSTFEDRKVLQSTKIYDKTGEILLYDVHKDIQRTVVPLSEISHHMKNATVAIEDAEFYKHHGIQPTSILRAVLVNIGARDFEQGGSTITQQVIKNSLLTAEKKITRKLKEWILALKIEKEMTKERILEFYLNEVPYGGNIYGTEEASTAFFNKNARELTLAESAYLAALPQAPTYYSPYGNNRDKLEERKNLVLERMHTLGFISKEDYDKALEESVVFEPQATYGIRAPHFVFFIIEQLERLVGKEMIERGGLRVITTLDYGLQEKAQEIIARHTKENTEKFNATNAGLVAIDPKTGDILAMVGSRDYFDAEIDGNFNITLAHRQPGSAFKPFVYATALKKGYTPETVVFDLQTQFHSGCDPEGKPVFDSVDEEECYMPSNYDDVFRGPVTFRNALAQSINIPAIKVLYLAGLRDSLDTARAMGITSLTDPSRYGLTLVLGGGEVSLLEITSAYSVFAAEGTRNPYKSILSVKSAVGKTLYTPNNMPEKILSKNVANQISSMLADNDARAPAFGERSYLYFENKDVAAKTGTTNDYRDAWIVGYTPSIAVGTWAGNNDNSPMEKKVAGFIVAPMWNEFMTEVIKDHPEETFEEPRPRDKESEKPVFRGVWKGGVSYFIDTVSGKRATEYTPPETKEERFVPEVHSILYWVNKHEPKGEKPEHPARDPQFMLWETPIKEWTEENNIQETTVSIPEEFDSVHIPENFPTISISSFDEKRVYNENDQVRIEVVGESKFGLSKVDLFINNTYIDSSKNKPFVFSFVPKNINNTKEINSIKIIGYDTIFNRGEITALFRVAIKKEE
jgi:1A family penicillin-binding protein